MDWLGILYPRRCALCDEVISDREYPVCLACRKQITPIRQNRCMHCSKPLGNRMEEFCEDCKRHRFLYDQGFAVFLYEGAVRESLMRFKYGNRQEYGRFYARMLDCFGGEKVRRWDPEVMIPVPVHEAKRRKRGYNQAEVLAKELQKIWKIPVDSRCMRRTKNTKAQKSLNHEERRKNLREAFAAKGSVGYKSVLIVDDIYTTGSTVDAMAKILREQGVERVYFVTVCIGRGM